MLQWIFGDVNENTVTEHNANTASGYLELQKASVNWLLSIDSKMLPADAVMANRRTFRTLEIDGEIFEFSEGFTEMHTQSYKEILNGKGFPLSETKKAIELVYQIRNQ